MNTYSKKSNFENFKKEVNEELTKRFIGTQVESKTYGKGQILEIEICDLDEENLEFDMYATILFSSTSRVFAIKKVLLTNSLNFDEETLTKFNKTFEELTPSIDTRVEEINEVITSRQEAERLKREAEALELKRQKDELKFKLKKDKMLEKLATLKPENTKKLFDTPVSHYEVLGWMAKHTTSIRAAMPDWMENQFVSMFGDVERYVVDSKKKTSGGFDYQWGLGLKISFDKEVAGPLEKRATSKNKKVIDSLTFVWDLIDNYGFTFGKKQDLDKIIDEVPDQYLADFQRGYAM